MRPARSGVRVLARCLRPAPSAHGNTLAVCDSDGGRIRFSGLNARGAPSSSLPNIDRCTERHAGQQAVSPSYATPSRVICKRCRAAPRACRSWLRLSICYAHALPVPVLVRYSRPSILPAVNERKKISIVSFCPAPAYPAADVGACSPFIAICRPRQR